MIVPSPSTRALNELMSSSIYNYLEQVETKQQQKQPQQKEEAKPQPIKPLYRKVLGHQSLHNWIKWMVILHIVRLQNPIQWANFLSLNKPIRQLLSHYRSWLPMMLRSKGVMLRILLTRLLNSPTSPLVHFYIMPRLI